LGRGDGTSWKTWECVPDLQGGFFDVCTLEGLKIRRFDAHGNLLWLRKYAQNAYYYSLTPLADGSFFAAAYNYAIGGPALWGFLCDAQGEVEKEWLLGESDLFRAFAADGASIVSAGHDSGSLMALDPKTGQIHWARILFTQGVPLSFNYSTVAIKPTSDGGFVFLGFREGGSYNQDGIHGTFVFKMSAEGHLQWAKAYDRLSFSGSYQESLKLSALPDGGLVLISGHIPQGQSSNDRVVVLCLNSDGTIRWQKRIWLDQRCVEGSLDYPYSAHITMNGKVLLDLWYYRCEPLYSGPWFLMVSPQDGSVVRSVTYGPDGSVYPIDLAVVPMDGGVVTFRDFSTADLQYLLRWNSDFSLPAACYPPSHTSLPFTWEDENFTMVEVDDVQEEDDPYVWSSEWTTNEGENWTEFQRSEIVCGESWPGIQSVKVLRDPFRLKIVGWNFQAGAAIRVNGLSVPHTQFKGKDRNNRTRLTASGSGLKALVPKGEAVTLTVVNADGKESVTFRFTR